MGLRILMVIDSYPPTLGGAQIQTQLLSRQLVQRGHEVSVVTVWQPGLLEQEDDRGVTVYRIKALMTRIPWLYRYPNTRRDPGPLPDPGLIFGLRSLIKQLRPDVVQVYGWIAYSCAGALLGYPIPMIVSSRDYGYSCATRRLMRLGQICDGPAYTKCLECAAHTWSPSRAWMIVTGIFTWRGLLVRKAKVFHSISTFVQSIVQRDLLHFRDHAPQLRTGTAYDIVIPNLFEPDDGVPDLTYLSRLPTQPFILFVGALADYKGLGVLLTAYQQLVSPPPLVLIGIVMPPYREGSFPPGVTVLHDVPHSTVMAAWERCLFAVAPSLVPETFGNVVTEAMSKGRTVIATNVGGPVDIVVQGVTGLLVPLGDVDALAEAMQRLIDDHALRERLGRAARERVKMYAADAIVPRFEELYRQVVINHHEIQQ